jgi:hypothetical protein
VKFYLVLGASHRKEKQNQNSNKKQITKKGKVFCSSLLGSLSLRSGLSRLPSAHTVVSAWGMHWELLCWLVIAGRIFHPKLYAECCIPEQYLSHQVPALELKLAGGVG